jgi:hypothetical protein
MRAAAAAGFAAPLRFFAAGAVLLVGGGRRRAQRCVHDGPGTVCLVLRHLGWLVTWAKICMLSSLPTVSQTRANEHNFRIPTPHLIPGWRKLGQHMEYITWKSFMTYL